ncbi:ABC transporter substrate-binding protein [Halotalea alkalilenta]|uniref:ABC transporter substrate-binding protein n=1 Tax=Halotalea alkalilenta TaxID=376489 RepID=UPI000AF3CE69|nr:spermidine/putrescine ABC transporter substrate-binding protein [Halotalea alkalilenta]
MPMRKLAALLQVGTLTFMSVALTPAQAQARETLYLFNWSEYMDPEIISEFEARYDVDVVQSYFGTIGELYARLQAGGDSQFDVIVPSNYYVPRLVNAGLVQPLDKDKLPHLDNLMPRFSDPDYDPDGRYSVAYQWGTTGIVYDTRAFPDAPESWSLLFDADQNPDQPFAIQGDGNVMVGAACAYLGHGYDCADRESWLEAGKLLLETRGRSNFTGFVDGTPVLQQLARGINRVGVSFNGDFLNARNEDPAGFEHLAYMIPQEGAELWVDSMMIPKNAPHPDLAHKFIDFILEPEIGARLSNWTYYSTPNQAALALLDDELRESPSQPSEEEMARLHALPSLDGAELAAFQQLWNEVRSR